LKANFKISSRTFSAVVFLTGGSLAWFFLIWNYLDRILILSPDWLNVGALFFYGFAVLSAIIGIILVKRVQLRKFLWLWVILGLISTAVLTFSFGLAFSLFSAAFLGFSLGLGLPSSMAFLADSTTVVERGKVAGTTILGTFVLAFTGIGIAGIFGSTAFAIVLVCVAIRSTSVLALVVDKYQPEKEKMAIQLLKPAYKEFIFYIAPWFIFNIAADLALNMIQSNALYQSATSTGNFLRFPLIAVFGFGQGIIADRFGRKQGVIIGLVMLGIGFFILGFFLQSFSVIVYYAISGVAWGSLFAIYLIVPGDLAPFGTRATVYALSIVAPLIIMGVIPLIPVLDVLAQNASRFSQALSVLLFLSIVPVLLAKETLSESYVSERKMRSYLEKVGKLVKENKRTK